jgi:hypothetical protein
MSWENKNFEGECYVSYRGNKGKVVLFTCHGGALGERRYSSYSFLTSAPEGGEWSASHPGLALPPGKEPLVPIV